MKIYLNEKSNRKQISSLRSQIKDKESLKKFDEFVAKNDYFDFNNDEHLQALKKHHCECHFHTTINV